MVSICLHTRNRKALQCVMLVASVIFGWSHKGHPEIWSGRHHRSQRPCGSSHWRNLSCVSKSRHCFQDTQCTNTQFLARKCQHHSTLCLTAQCDVLPRKSCLNNYIGVYCIPVYQYTSFDSRLLCPGAISALVQESTAITNAPNAARSFLPRRPPLSSTRVWPRICRCRFLLCPAIIYSRNM